MRSESVSLGVGWLPLEPDARAGMSAFRLRLKGAGIRLLSRSLYCRAGIRIPLRHPALVHRSVPQRDCRTFRLPHVSSGTNWRSFRGRSGDTSVRASRQRTRDAPSFEAWTTSSRAPSAGANRARTRTPTTSGGRSRTAWASCMSSARSAGSGSSVQGGGTRSHAEPSRQPSRLGLRSAGAASGRSSLASRGISATSTEIARATQARSIAAATERPLDG